jgi:PAS domain S-box-containing protein
VVARAPTLAIIAVTMTAWGAKEIQLANRGSRIASKASKPLAFDQVHLEALPVPAFLCDRKGALTHYNRRAVAFWGFAPDLPSSGGTDERIAAVLRSGEPADGIEMRIARQAGEPLACLVNVAPLRDAAGTIVGGIATIRGHIERAALEALPVALLIIDTAGWVTAYNQATIDLLGHRPSLGSDQWWDGPLFRADGTKLHRDEYPTAIALKENQPVHDVELIAERGDGTRVALMPLVTPLHDATGALTGTVTVLMDVSARKRAEQAAQQMSDTLEQRVEEVRQEMSAAFERLHESEHRFRLLVQGVADYAIFMLDPSGHVTNWNSGAQRIKGYSADEIIGQHFSRFYGEDDRAAGVPYRALETARSTGKYEGEGWRFRKDGTAFWASVVIDAIHDDDGTLIGFAKVTRDLTEKRAADERLRQAQKMEAIGQLTGGVAHDFNNLLTAIIGNLELLVTAMPTQERAQRYAAAALRAASRGSRLTEHLLAFSRRQELRPEIVSINRLLNDIVMLCQRTVGDGIELALRLQDDLWTCGIDVAQFGAAVLNLLGNARDAMNGVGQITIATENVATVATDSSDLEPGDYVSLAVSDTGVGMSATVLSRAFEPFYTTKEVGKGTGLGLSQVYGFTKQSGGIARIESRAGVGTTVRLYLPRKDGEPASDGAAEQRSAAKRNANATILVVDDDNDVREMIVEILGQLGYGILVATNGPEALAVLRRDDSVDLLFSDVVMPAGMSGVELARAARRLRPALKVLLSSGHPGDTRAQPIQPEFPFIAKPYRPSVLGARIAEVLAQAGTEGASSQRAVSGA